MKHALIATVTCATICAASCDPSWTVEYDPTVQQEIVVEGWIENNGFAQVILSRTIGLDEQADSLAIIDSTVRWAKVTVSDGSRSEVLTGRFVTGQIPPYVYTGNTLRGQVGGTYTLTVEYSGRVLTATTTIPQPLELDSVTVSRSEASDTLYQVRAHFTDADPGHNYYKLFTRVWGRDNRYFSSFMGTFDDSSLGSGGGSGVPVYRAFRHIDLDHYTPFFSHTDTLSFKFAQLPRHGFVFWTDYENEVTNGKNPIFPSIVNLSGNIEGGYGIWCGYGTTTHHVSIADSIK